MSSEAIILSKLKSVEVSTNFLPVLIYRVEKDKSYLAGSGTYFRGKSGEQIITSEHLFRKELGNRTFAFRTLKPFEADISHGISNVFYRGASLGLFPGESPDVCILRVGNMQSIECYSDRSLDSEEFKGLVSKVSGVSTLRSLISGEEVRLLATMKSEHEGGTTYVLINYDAISGESGMGFVDDKDRLYVLKGIPMLDKKEKEEIKNLLGIDHGLSMAYGPYEFRR